MQLLDVAKETASTAPLLAPMRPRALAICARCPWSKESAARISEFRNSTAPSAMPDWFERRCSAAYVKDVLDGNRLVRNPNYGFATGLIATCKEWGS
jgi:hypothetical protein